MTWNMMNRQERDDLFKAVKGYTIIGIDFDDTILDKSQNFPLRFELFKVLANGKRCDTLVFVLTARSTRIDEIERYCAQNDINVDSIVYNMRDKGNDIIDLNSESAGVIAHFDDDEEVCTTLVKHGIAAFYPYEFAVPKLVREWRETLYRSGELKHYIDAEHPRIK